MKVNEIDHIVLTVNDLNKTLKFYTNVLGMELVKFEGDRVSLRFGKQKINLHKKGQEISPHAEYPLPGTADICFITETSIKQVVEHFNSFKITILKGPVSRTGATGPLLSIYIQDPDGNLIEIANRLED